MSDAQPTTTSTMSKEDLAFFVNTIWSSLLVPSWLRDDLIELGKAVYAKTPLAKLDDKKFAQLLPFLKVVAESLGDKIYTKLAEMTQPLIDENLRLQATNAKVKAEIELLQEKMKEKPAPATAVVASVVPLQTSVQETDARTVAIVGVAEATPQDVAIAGVVDIPKPTPEPTPNDNAAPKPPETTNG